MDATIFQILFMVAVVVIQLVVRLLRARAQRTPERTAPGPQERLPRPQATGAATGTAPGSDHDDAWPFPFHDEDEDDDDYGHDRGHPAVAAAHQSHHAAPTPEHAALIAQTDALILEARALLEPAHRDPATRRPAQVIEDYVLPRAESARQDLAADRTTPTAARARLAELSMIMDATEWLIAQRRSPHLRRALGDADALAQACYQPVLDFARTNRLALASADPVALLTPFDMGIWVGFAPTGVAPLFLPPRFFDDIRWWPAVAHEIGHDFLVATPGSDAGLRDQLGLPSEAAGARLIDHLHGGLSLGELVRIHGAWFEEIFCDLFGTMMMGPAYGYTMVALFARPDAPESVATVRLAPNGYSYDLHPPRHLRVLLCARALRLLGEHQAADELLAEWTAIHGEQPVLWVPTVERAIGVPMEIMEQIGDKIVTALHGEGMIALDGHALSDIPGLAYGPHRAAETRRACNALLAGRAPTGQQARAVVAGAVLAWREAPERAAAIMVLARQAIVGVTETRVDAYSAVGNARDMSWSSGSDLGSRESQRQALILHTLLAPPPSVRRRPSARQGFLARRSWP